MSGYLLLKYQRLRHNKFIEELYSNVYLMDNHKWALYCWEFYRQKKQLPSTLVHLDYHWDAINDCIVLLKT